MRPRQLSFLPRPEIEHGGDYRKGTRKTRRPFDPKRALHVTLRSSRARGAGSLLRPAHKWRVYELLERTARRRRIRVYRFANVGNHVHLIVQARTHADLKAFLREFAGVVAVMVTGAVKGRPEKFWEGRPWSKIIEWGRQFQNATRYVLLNVMESSGSRDRKLLSRLERERVVLIGPEPGS